MLREHKQWKDFLARNFDAFHQLNLTDLLVTDLSSRQIISPPEEQDLIAETTQYRRALRFNGILRTDVQRFNKLNFSALISTLEKHKCYTVAGLIRKHGKPEHGEPETGFDLESAIPPPREQTNKLSRISFFCLSCIVAWGLINYKNSSAQSNPVLPVAGTQKTTAVSIVLPLLNVTNCPDWINLAYKHPYNVLEEIPRFVSEIYTNSSFFCPILTCIADLPALEHRIIGFTALYDQVFLKLLPGVEVAQLASLGEQVQKLEKYIDGNVPRITVGTETEILFRELLYKLQPMIVIGETAYCEITNVFYKRQIGPPSGEGESRTVRLFPKTKKQSGEHSHRWQVDASLETGQLTFRIYDTEWSWYRALRLCHSPSRNSMKNTNNDKNSVESWVGCNWKFIPVQDKKNEFIIMTPNLDQVSVASTAQESDGSRLIVDAEIEDLRFKFNHEAHHWVFDCHPKSN